MGIVDRLGGPFFNVIVVLGVSLAAQVVDCFAIFEIDHAAIFDPVPERLNALVQCEFLGIRALRFHCFQFW